MGSYALPLWHPQLSVIPCPSDARAAIVFTAHHFSMMHRSHTFQSCAFAAPGVNFAFRTATSASLPLPIHPICMSLLLPTTDEAKLPGGCRWLLHGYGSACDRGRTPDYHGQHRRGGCQIQFAGGLWPSRLQQADHLPRQVLPHPFMHAAISSSTINMVTHNHQSAS